MRAVSGTSLKINRELQHPVRRLCPALLRFDAENPGSSLLQTGKFFRLSSTACPLDLRSTQNLCAKFFEQRRPRPRKSPGPLPHAIGLQMGRQDDLRASLNRLTGGDAEAVLKFQDILRTAILHIVRVRSWTAPQTQSGRFGSGHLGLDKDPSRTALRPLRALRPDPQSLQMGAAANQVRMLKDFVTKGTALGANARHYSGPRKLDAGAIA
jgi:hypothetical protein